MSNGDDSTGHWDAVIAELRADLARYEREEASALELAGEMKQQAETTNLLIEQLKVRLGSKSRQSDSELPPSPQPEPVKALSDFLADLQLGDACVAVLRREARPMTNRDILDALADHGFKVNGDNPINNIGSCLNHRAGAKGDIMRDGKHWQIADKEERSAPTSFSPMTEMHP